MEESRRSRRSILTAGATGLGATLLARGISAAPANDPPTASKPAGHCKAAKASFKLSLSAYSFRKHLDSLERHKKGEMSLLDLVDLCVELGLDGIETTSYYFLKTDDESIYALKRKTFLAGLVNTGMPIRSNFALPNGPEFDREIEQVNKWVDIAAKLGAPNMRVFAGRPNKQMSREQIFDQVVKGLKRACAYAGTKGVFLAMENHGFMTETADNVIAIVKAVDHPWMGANLDTGNFSGDHYGEVRKLAKHAIVCQFKTQVSDPGGGGKKNRKPADYGRLFQILREVNYRGSVALEYEGEDARKEVPIEIRKIQAAMRA